MISINKKEVKETKKQKILLFRMGMGLTAALKNPIKAALLLIYVVAAVWIWVNRGGLINCEGYGPFTVILSDFYSFALLMAEVACTMLLLVLLGTPIDAVRARNSLMRAGVVNHLGEPPLLLSKKKNRRTGVITWCFDANEIPRSRWEEWSLEIESALNISIIDIRSSNGRRRILIQAVPAKGDLPNRILWNDTYLPAKESVVRLGVGLASLVETDIANRPHIYIGGSTGSGKTILFKSILYQLKRHGHKVFICDLKGGADFGFNWRGSVPLVYQEEQLLTLLKELVEIMNTRKSLFREFSCANINEYNKHNLLLPRYILGIDEIAEVFGRGGNSKESKDLKNQIEEHLSLIARQGRAFGIHLVVATQRGDANVMPAQLRSNLDTKIAGRCDAVLSQIILDSADAAKMIPKNSCGRFLTNSGEIFQGFLLEEDQLSW